VLKKIKKSRIRNLGQKGLQSTISGQKKWEKEQKERSKEDQGPTHNGRPSRNTLQQKRKSVITLNIKHQPMLGNHPGARKKRGRWTRKDADLYMWGEVTSAGGAGVGGRGCDLLVC